MANGSYNQLQLPTVPSISATTDLDLELRAQQLQAAVAEPSTVPHATVDLYLELNPEERKERFEREQLELVSFCGSDHEFKDHEYVSAQFQQAAAAVAESQQAASAVPHATARFDREERKEQFEELKAASFCDNEDHQSPYTSNASVDHNINYHMHMHSDGDDHGSSSSEDDRHEPIFSDHDSESTCTVPESDELEKGYVPAAAAALAVLVVPSG